jgi:Rhodopirellula transposase DDE domain
VPYGVYDLAANSGWVSVGVDHDTAAFAVNSIRQCWRNVGRLRYPDAARLLITADGGGSNGWRVRLWKRKLQKTANKLGLDIVFCRLLPGTSKLEQDRAPALLLHQPKLARSPLVSADRLRFPRFPRKLEDREMLTFAHIPQVPEPIKDLTLMK